MTTFDPRNETTAAGWLEAIAGASDDEVAWLAPHVYDAIGQLVCGYIEQRGASAGRPQQRMTLDRHDKTLRGIDAQGKQVARALKAFESAARRVRHGQVGGAERAAERAAFEKASEGLIEVLKPGDARVRSLAPVGHEVQNGVSIDTKHGYRFVNLVHALVTTSEADVLVLSADQAPAPEEGAQTSKPGTTAGASAPRGAGAVLGGVLFESLSRRYGLAPSLETPFLTVTPTYRVYLERLEARRAPFGRLLTLQVGEKRADCTLDAYLDELLSGLFAAVAAMEVLGHPTRRLALPMLKAHKLREPDAYDRLVAAIIRHAVDWLKRSEHTEQIDVCVYQGDELDMWAECMDRQLGRTLVSAGKDAAVEQLAREVRSHASKHGDGPLKKALDPLCDQLARVDRIRVEQVATEGRKLAELMLAQMLERHGEKPHRELMKTIELATAKGLCAPWMASYFHTLRVMGNEGVHARAPDRLAFRPDRLGKVDLVGALAAIRAVLDFWHEAWAKR